MRKWGQIWLVLLITQLKAEIPTYVFHQLTIKDGLSEGTIRAINEDRQGYMWFGTEDGLNKFDGYKFTVYKNDPKDSFSITSNNIKCFYNSQDGFLWVGTRHGVNIYDKVLDRFYNSNTARYTSLKDVSGDVERIIAGRNGVIWIATSTNGLYKINSLFEKPEHFQFSENGNASVFMDIDLNKNDNLIISTNDGLLEFDTHNNHFRDLRSKYGSGYQIRDLFLDRNGVIWMATVQGLKCIKNEKLKDFEHDALNENSIQGINVIRILPEENGLLLAIDGSGIDLLDPEKEIFYHYSKDNGTQLNSNNTTALFRDSKGTLWTGTFLNGINFSNVSTNFFVSVKNNSSPTNSVKNGVVTGFLKDSHQNLWISTDGGGLFIKKNKTEHFLNYNYADKNPVIGSNAVLCVLEDKEGDIWISTYAGGLTRLSANGRKKIFKHNPADSTSIGWNKIKAICEYQNKIWISTYGMGITVCDKQTKNFKQYRYTVKNKTGLPSDWVYWFLNDSKGNLWLATFEGLAKYLPEKDQFETYQFNKLGTSIDKNYVFEIFEDRDQNLWLGTNGGGLVLFDRDSKEFKSYTTANGLSDNTVRTIIQDNNGDLWLGTNDGITQFNVKKRKAISYKISDGLPAGSFFFNSKYKDENGKIYLGMNDGYLIIDPSLANIKAEFPKVELSEFSLFNNPIGPNSQDTPLKTHISQTGEISLPYDQNSVSFEFAALNYNTPKHNYYAYFLEGFDKEWNYSGKNRLAKYTNLDPGTYVFHVKASNNPKMWGPGTKDFVIHIASPFWKTLWFKLSAFLLAVTGVFGTFYLRTKAITDRNRWLFEQVNEKTKELADEKDLVLEKKHELEKSNEQLLEWSQFQNKLIGIISHDIRGPLQNFSLLLQLQDEQSAEWVKAKLKQTADSLSILATDLLSWVSLQSQKGEVEFSEFSWMNIIDKAQNQLKSSWEPKQIHFVIKDEEQYLLKGVAPMVLAALRNIMSNSIRFSPQGGTIEIETGIRHNGFAGFRITDYGSGFDCDRINKIIRTDAFAGVKDSNLKESAGLGLAICYDMIKRTGGLIEAASLPGSGATFFIYLPFVEKAVLETR